MIKVIKKIPPEKKISASRKIQYFFWEIFGTIVTYSGFCINKTSSSVALGLLFSLQLTSL